MVKKNAKYVFRNSGIFDYRMAMKFCQRKLRKPPLTTSQNNVQPRSSGLLPVPLICWLQRAGFNVPNRSVIVPSYIWKTKWHTPFCISLIASSISRAFEVAIVKLPVIFAIAVIRLIVIGLFVVTTILLVFRITLFNLIQRYRKFLTYTSIFFIIFLQLALFIKYILNSWNFYCIFASNYQWLLWLNQKLSLLHLELKTF